MSVRIYNGFELVGLTLETALDALRKLREPARIQACRLTAREVLHMAVTQFDAVSLQVPTAPEVAPNGNHLFEAALRLRDLQDEVVRTGRRNPRFDTSLSVCLIPTQGRLLGVAYGENPAMLQVLKACPAYRELPYWDGTEAPEDVSDAEWDARKGSWQAALPQWGAPGEFGLSYDLVPDWALLCMTADCADALDPTEMPTLARRAANMAHELLDADQLDGVAAPQKVSDACRLLESPLWAQACARVAERLNPNLTLDDLRGQPASALKVVCTFIPDA